MIANPKAPPDYSPYRAWPDGRDKKQQAMYRYPVLDHLIPRSILVRNYDQE